MESKRSAVRKIVGGAVVAALIGVLSAGALMAGGAGQGGPGGRRMFGPMGGPGGGFLMGLPGLRQLGVTDAQREQIRTIVEQHRQETQALAERAFAARKELHDAIAVEPINEGLIREKAAALAAVEADGAVLGAQVRAQVFQILTPEQQQKARQLRADMEKRMEERRTRMRERLKQ